MPAPERWLCRRPSGERVGVAAATATDLSGLVVRKRGRTTIRVPGPGVRPRHATQHAFLEGHVEAFAFLGGVPARVRYDNLSSAVKPTLKGRQRVLADRFVALRVAAIGDVRHYIALSMTMASAPETQPPLLPNIG